MATRERRASSLAGLSPVTAAPTPIPAPSAPAELPRAAAEADNLPMPQKAKKAERTKVGYYATPYENARIRAAFMAGQARYGHVDGYRSLTDFQLTTIMDKVAELEAELNGGDPFPGVPPRGGPLGRPLA